MAWGVYDRRQQGDGVHAIPLGDGRDHYLTSGCWCRPVETDPDCYTHNALDAREVAESVARRPQ